VKIIIGSKLDQNIKLAFAAKQAGDTEEAKRLRKERLAALDLYDGPIFDRNAAEMSDEILTHELLWSEKNNDNDNADLIAEAVKRGWEVSK